MLNRFLDYAIHISGDYSITVGKLIVFAILLVLSYLAYKLTYAKWRIDFFNKHNVETGNRRKFEKYLRQFVLLFSGFVIIRYLNLDFELYNLGKDGEEGISIRYSFILLALLLLVAAWILDWYLSNIIVNQYSKDRSEEGTKINEASDEVRTRVTKNVQYIVVILACIAILKNFGLDYEMFPYQIKNVSHSFRPSLILFVLLIFLFARIVSWVLTQVALYGFYKRKDIDQGAQFAINQLIKYVIYIVAVLMAINTLGINMTIVWGGAAALLVGVGLGLQQTFNDFFSGLVLLFERTVSVGDIMEVNGIVGTVTKIGLRSSIIETRANVSIIIPNSQLVNDAVKNWTHFVDYGRFEVNVGVAYGSDTNLVKKLLLSAVNENNKVLDYPTPFVRFNHFNDSSLDFTVLFFSNRFLIIEDIKSDIRFKIDALFRENGISIPFPQRDVWIKSETD